MDEDALNRLAYQQQIIGKELDSSMRQQQQQVMIEEREKGLAEAQLDVDLIIEKIQNLLQGKEWVADENGIMHWREPKNHNMKTLSDWGVHRIMQTINFHINKNTLLSNFNEDQINRLMLSFTTEMNDLVLLKYEKLFKEISFEDCKKILEDRIKNKIKLRLFASEVLGNEISKKKIESDVMKEMEGLIEDEIYKIKKEQMKDRLKEYGLILEELEIQVFACYNRAWKGEERGSLRRHTNFSDIRTLSQPQPQQNRGLFGWVRG